MQTKDLVKIIKAEAVILTDLIDGLSNDGNIQSYEVELIVNKINVINSALMHLQPDIAETLRQSDLAVPKTEQKPDQQKINFAAPGKVQETIVVPKPKAKTEPTINIPTFDLVPEEPARPSSVAMPNNESVELTDNIEIIESKKPEEIEKPKKEAVKEPKHEPGHKKQPQEKPESKNTLADKYQNEAYSVNDMLSGIKKKHDLASKFNQQPIIDLKKSIKINDRIRFINELFARDTGLYEQTIAAINQAGSLDEALALIFPKFKWDQENEITIHFLELVFRRFQNQQ